MECQGKEKKMVLVGLRERTGKRDWNPVGDVAVGELLWPFFFLLSNRWCSNTDCNCPKQWASLVGHAFLLFFLGFSSTLKILHNLFLFFLISVGFNLFFKLKVVLFFSGINIVV